MFVRGALGVVAAWGILESVILAGLFTLIEAGGLIAIVAVAVHADLPIAAAFTAAATVNAARCPASPLPVLLAFFAFIGFEDLANVVEEAKAPRRDIPRAMVLTLLISTILYVGVAAVAVSAVSIERLSLSPAPLSLVFREIAGVSPATISAIAIVATLNTILAQMTMAARVIYGMARQGDLPGIAGRVHPRTATPLVATALIVASVITLALTFPLERLAESTSLATLGVFALVNLALLRLRHRGIESRVPHVTIPIWMPAIGLATCTAMIAQALLK